MNPKKLVLVNAKIYPLTAPQVHHSALAIQGTRILSIGSTEKIIREFGQDSQIEDLEGKVILPGLTDGHIHLQHYALNLQKINCETSTRQEFLHRVAEKAKTTPPGTWILGHGWNQNNWPEGYGNPRDLDRAAPNNPVFLTAKSLHAGWTNTLGMQLAEISSYTQVPQDGQLSRDHNGNPNGILFETAMDLIVKVIPTPTIDAVKEAILLAQPILWQFGLTGVHDFDRRTCFSALQSIQRDGNLKLRIVKSIPLEDLPSAVSIGIQTGYGNDFLRIGSVKAFSDGALGPHTAAMLAPYEDDPENQGILMLDSEDIYEFGSQAVKNGLSIAVHAIGDRAIHEILNGFSQVRKFQDSMQSPSIKNLRHRIEHVQIIHLDDAARLAELGIIASMQPIHATSDMRMADRYWGSRAAYSYAWKLQLQHNTKLVFGSDAPVESPNPFWGIHAAVTRQDRDNYPGPKGWYPEQCIDVYQTLKAYTSGTAYAAGMENRLGLLSPGYLADLIVLETDPFTCLPEQLHTILPEATMVNGEWVFRKF